MSREAGDQRHHRCVLGLASGEPYFAVYWSEKHPSNYFHTPASWPFPKSSIHPGPEVDRLRGRQWAIPESSHAEYFRQPNKDRASSRPLAEQKSTVAI